MNNEWTQGPWRIGDAGQSVFGPPNGKPAPAIIAMHIARRANARLIAAAPDLATILRFAVDTWGDALDADEDISGADAVDYLSGLVEQARALLARIAGDVTP